jgi:hypothetical protein
MSKEQPNQPRESVKLAYIGNVYSTLNAFWGLRSRLALAVGVLSVILLGIALGVVSPKTDNFNFNLAGLDLKIPLAWFLVVGAAVLAALVVTWYAVLFRVNSLYLEMIRLYSDLYYIDKALRDPLKNPFHSATFYGALRAPYLSKRWRNRQYGRKLWFVKGYEWVAAQAVAHLFVGWLPIATEFVILVRLITIVVEPQERKLPTIFGWLVKLPTTDGWLVIMVAASLICFGFALGAWLSYIWKKPRDV